MPKYRKPVRPVLARNHPLYRGLGFATAPWWRGSTDTGSEVDLDDISRTRGVIQGSISGAYELRDMGVTLSAGDSRDETFWESPAVKRLANARNGAVCAALLWENDEATQVGDAGMFGKRAGVAGSDDGWSIYMLDSVNPDAIRFQTADGSGTDEVDDNIGTPVPNAITFLTTCRGLGDVNGNTNTLEIDRDGKLNDITVSGSPDPAVTNNEPVAVFGNTAGGDEWDGEIGMAAMWSRRLPRNAMLRLWVDPYQLWKQQHREFMFGPGFNGSAFFTYFLSF